MSKHAFWSGLAIGSLVLSTALACSEGTISAPDRLRPPEAPSKNVIQAVAGSVQLCTRGVPGLSTYALSYVGGVGSSDVYATPQGNSITMLSGDCATVFTATLTEPLLLDPVATVSLNQNSHPAGSVFSYTLLTEYDEQAPCNPDTDPCGADVKGTSASLSVRANAYHGSVVSYWNAPLGCAYTQGYWKNHTSSWPAGYSPTAMFYASGKSWIDLFNTPPKGSAYIILAHQYMAAALNVANGAYMPPTTQTTFDAAAAYFAGGAGGDLTAWASILDNYNNGLVAGGPPHCD